MTKRDNDKLNSLYLEAFHPSLKAQSGTVYAIIYDAPYEGQRTLGIYSSPEDAQREMKEYVDEDNDPAQNHFTIKPLVLNQKADWNYSVR